MGRASTFPNGPHVLGYPPNRFQFLCCRKSRPQLLQLKARNEDAWFANNRDGQVFSFAADLVSDWLTRRTEQPHIYIDEPHVALS
jgi:hypothetical protein